MGAGYQTLSGDPEILPCCVLTMSKVQEVETLMGNLVLSGKNYQREKNQNLRSTGTGAQASGQRLQPV